MISPAPRLAANRPGLATPDRCLGNGVGYVGSLLERAMRDVLGEPRVVDLAPAQQGVVTVAERARFIGRLAVHGPTTGWWLYTHVGVARAQRMLPAPLRRPYGVFLHGVEVWATDLDASRLAALTGARLRVANSRLTASRAMTRLPGIGVVEACPLALLPDRPAAGSIDAGVVSVVDRNCAVIVARMSAAERYKGHDQLLEVWPEVRATHPAARLLVIGTGDDLPRLRAKAGELAVDDAVLFAGFVSEATLDAVLARAGVFAMPSRGEGFGLVYLQAMRAGLPCIASPEDAGGEVVIDGRTGLLAAQHDRAALRSALVTLLCDRAASQRMGEAGRALFHSVYTYEAFRDRFREIVVRAFGETPEVH